MPYDSSGKVSLGNVNLDSGALPMYMPQDFYDRLIAQVKQQIPLDPIVGDINVGTQLCYRSNDQNNFHGPILTVHFEGADVILTSIQAFPQYRDGIFCFSLLTSETDFGVYGSFVQSNFLIGYDIEKRTVSFKPTDCTK